MATTVAPARPPANDEVLILSGLSTGLRLRLRRLRLHWSQMRLAHSAGVPQTAVAAVELDRQRYDPLTRERYRRAIDEALTRAERRMGNASDAAP